MKKFSFLFFSLLVFVSVVYAQDVKPNFEILEFDLIARTKPRLDLNEVPCAVLRISAADIKGYQFEGNIIGDIVYAPGEALIYMTNNSRNITIKSDLFGTMKYEFPERLRKQVAYKLSLKVEAPEETYKEKELADVMAQSKKQLKKRSTKTARQEAKQFKKEGWKTAPGTIPMEKQLDKSYAIQQQYNGDFESAFLMGQAISVGRTYDAARMQAMELAKLELASLIESTISIDTENAISNKQLAAEEAISIVEMVQKSKSQVLQRLGKVIVVMELYRDTNTGKEVLVRIAYDTNKSKKEAIEAIRKQLDLSPEWGEKLGGILGVKEI
jgi:hypothetical protein